MARKLQKSLEDKRGRFRGGEKRKRKKGIHFLQQEHRKLGNGIANFCAGREDLGE